MPDYSLAPFPAEIPQDGLSNPQIENRGTAAALLSRMGQVPSADLTATHSFNVDPVTRGRRVLYSPPTPDALYNPQDPTLAHFAPYIQRRLLSPSASTEGNCFSDPRSRLSSPTALTETQVPTPGPSAMNACVAVPFVARPANFPHNLFYARVGHRPVISALVQTRSLHVTPSNVWATWRSHKPGLHVTFKNPRRPAITNYAPRALGVGKLGSVVYGIRDSGRARGVNPRYYPEYLAPERHPTNILESVRARFLLREHLALRMIRDNERRDAWLKARKARIYKP
ncbi:hypothetical protein FISHEDRAFT_58945 [Fistulina hepatica ATCC 64428]|uniref:Uncharacterized protein n=1 Tax=Fistulina hepatica ATCC 64428 TaxID=1128425 RepID=A0A0D7ABS7_9AGAR|nr:hypothetical protein FISHEDRAFT_58945 [Fistulina hepatica ATCC 64428]